MSAHLKENTGRPEADIRGARGTTSATLTGLPAE
jgi:hypothetical protein